MDLTAINQVADALWPLIATGAVGRVGELGTERAIDAGGSLLSKVSSNRRDRGVPEAPASRDELLEELRELAATADGAEAVQAVHNHFYAPVDARGANFGIQNGR